MTLRLKALALAAVSSWFIGSSALSRSDPRGRTMVFWGAWHVLISAWLGAVALAALGVPPSASPEMAQVVLLIFGYLGLSVYIVPAAASPISLVSHVVVAAAVGFGGAYALLATVGIPVSPWLIGTGAAGAAVSALVPYMAMKVRIPAIVTIILAGTAAIGFNWMRPEAVDPRERTIRTSFHGVTMMTYTKLITPPVADGGAIDGHGSGMILVTGDGRLYWITLGAPGEKLTATPLSIPRPMDRDAYLADFDEPAKAPRLRVTDVTFDPRRPAGRLYVSHQAWNNVDRCYTMQISALSLDWTSDGVPIATGEWRKIFASQPCLGATGLFNDSEAGGRLAWDATGSLLLTLGDFGFAGLDGTAPFALRDDVDYGKILRIVPGTGTSSVVSIGHRNPQGLAVARNGRIWESEHGPQGGDEINLITDGGNYGWPNVTYGVEYGSTSWPLNPSGRNHAGYREPVVAFVPSIATSSLIEVSGQEFPLWEGDLLLASLRAQALYRIRLRDDRVIYIEPMEMELRIRDLALASDGRVVLWTDSGILTELRRGHADNAFDRFCTGCHSPAFGTPAGPRLDNVHGRDIASQPGFDYSPALRKLGGIWTKAALDAFLSDPGAYAPGTSMLLSDLDDQSRAEIIAYLTQKQD